MSRFIFKKLYKTLSEVKLEVETVIKTGRHIVQKQQTDNPKVMDEQLTSLKVLYNDLGAQVRIATCSTFLALAVYVFSYFNNFYYISLNAYVNITMITSCIEISF